MNKRPCGSLATTLALFALLSVLGRSLHAAENVSPLPDIEPINERLQQLEARQDSDAQTLKETYQEILRRLSNVRANREQAAAFSQIIEDYPRRIQQLEQQLIRGDGPVSKPASPVADLLELQQQQALSQTRLVELESDLDALLRQIATIESRLQLLPELLAQTKERLSGLAGSTPAQSANGELAEAYRMLASVHQEELSSRIKSLELEQLSSDNRRNLAEAERQLVKHQISRVEQRLEGLQQSVSERRRQQTEQTIEQARQKDQKVSGNPLVRYAVEKTQRYSSELKALSEASAQLSEQKSDLIAQLRSAENLHKQVIEQLSVPNPTTTAGASLRAKLAQLPPSYDLRSIERQLERAQLDAYQLEQQSSALPSIDEYVAQYENQTGHSAAEIPPELETVISGQRELVNQLSRSYTTYINELAQLEQSANQLNNTIDEVRGQITEHLLWLPNTLPVGSQWLMQVTRNVQWMLVRFDTDSIQASLADHSEHLTLGVLLLAAAAGLHRIGQKRLPQLQKRYQQLLGNVTRDHIGTSVHLFGAVSLYALPLPILLYGYGELIIDAEPQSLATAFGKGLVRSAPLLYLFRWWYLASAPDGLLRTHFGWSRFSFDALRRVYRASAWAIVPLIVLIAIGEDHGNAHLNNGIGRAAFMALCLLTAYLYAVTLKHYHWQESNGHLAHPALQRVIKAAVMALPIACALLAAYGYFFTGIKLLITLQQTVLMILGGILLYAAGMRWLLVEERRLAFNRAKARRAEQQAQRAKEEVSDERPTESVEENLIDLRTVSEHSKVLLRTTIVIGTAVLVGILWSEVFRALNFLDQITIWQVSAQGESGTTLEAITLKEILFAVAMIGLTLIAVRNLPGVMEILVLQHLALAPGTGYALTTLLKYLLVAAGTLYSFDLLGFEWSKLQWLVAALGVGLGFGLQEIFANFVSGLILLFEKPIRIGDTVTINNLTGTVTKIQIRATTIVDWDRKEIIVPNKAFITDQLVNWSLSDAITRQIITVGVAYGSDSELATRLLLEAAEAVPQILTTPKPEAYFVSFGASSLDFELRVFVNDMAHRLPVRHALHDHINRLFAEHQIEIAFPQMDVHLKRG